MRAFTDAGYRVTCLDLDASGAAAEDARSFGAIVLGRDATELDALQTARVDRAEFVVCACPDDAVNTKIASLVATVTHLSKSRHVPSVHVRVDDPELAGLLRGPLASIGSARFHFFNTSAVWARAVLDDPAGPFARPGATAPRIAVIGSTSLGSAVGVGAARRWHRRVRDGESEGRAHIVVVGPDAADLCSALLERYPAIGRVCDLVPIARSLSHGLVQEAADVLCEGAGPSAVYCCLDDHSANLALALDAEHRLQDRAPIFIPATASAGALAPLLLGAGLIRPVVLPAGGASLELLHDQMREALAREAHETWLAQRQREDDFGSRPADRPWEELDESFRRANRHQIDGMVDQLQAVWYDLEPRYDWDEPLPELPPTSVEAMAQLEHARWCRERLEDGWKPGPVRDDRRRIHDLLVPWSKLSEQVREIDRVIVRARPALLADAGFRLTRDPAREKLARLLHERYQLARESDGEDGPNAVDWSELPEAAKELNRSAVDDFALKLAHIDCRAIRGSLAVRDGFAFEPGEVEALAELEHERWLRERLEAGWRLGDRDDAALTHPSLVPWSELSESERAKDREVVEAIPSLLRTVGYTIVRDDPPAPSARFRLRRGQRT